MNFIKLGFTLIFIGIYCLSFSQSIDTLTTTSAYTYDSVYNNWVTKNGTPKVFTLVEQMPEFPGGEKKLMEYLQKNISYPKIAIDSTHEGKSLINFVVYEDGSIHDVYVKRSSGYKELDNEAKRVIFGMPNWTPGKQQGKAVRVSYMVPIIFRLNDNTIPSPPLPPSRSNLIFTAVEQMPEFPGGEKAMEKFIINNLVYPEASKTNQNQGKVIVGCIIFEDGSIHDVIVMRTSSFKDLDEEAVRLVKSMPNWKPGTQQRKAVKVRYMIPIKFQLP